MVIALHVSAPLAVRFNSIAWGAWWTANVFESFTRPAVPLFVMVSGLLLLAPHRAQPIGAFLRRRLTRVLVPFLIWATLYLLWRRYYHGEALSLPEAVMEILSGPVYTHFWFIYMLLGLYLVTPILQVFTRHASRAQLWYFVLLWFLSSAALPMLQRLTGIHLGIGWTVTLGFVGYYVLGHMLCDWTLSGGQMIGAIAGVVLLAGLTAAATYGITVASNGTLNETFYDNLSPNVVLMAALLLLVLRSLPLDHIERHNSARTALERLGEVAFGIYLVHPMIQEALQGGMLGVSLSGLSFVPLLSVPLTALAVFGLSLLVVLLIRRAPGGRFIAP
jgi:surface polysaccharide O-acyltransferase-like enzyme